MNFVVIMTDTQNRSMVGAYGNPAVDTPGLDRLAASGIRFDRAYTTCPLCTPARSAIFSGLHPPYNGAWTNGMTPHANVPLMGSIFRQHGYRAAYTGKWHLDGEGYFGTGQPDGGFEPDWWYDGTNYARDIGQDLFYHYVHSSYDLTPAEMGRIGFTEENIWAHRVASRAIDFLEQVRDNEPFVLAVSFDEPHAPWVAPPEYWEKFRPEDIPVTPNFNASVENKPRMQQLHREWTGTLDWLEFAATQTHFFGCNSYVDREIGRVIEAVERLHDEDTLILYTSDHGDMLRAHGMVGKGPMMYEETNNVPFILRVPGGPSDTVSNAVVTHVDIMATLLDYAGIEQPPRLHGVSLRPVVDGSSDTVQDYALMSFGRFGNEGDNFGAFYPIRAVTDGRYKLVINLLDTDEFYDLAEDPGETLNRIDDAACRDIRDHLHDRLLAEMERTVDCFCGPVWGQRPWRTVRSTAYHVRHPARSRPGFPFMPRTVQHDPEVVTRLCRGHT